MLVGLHGLDDASVYDLGDGRALVQTVDFFPPIVDDPFTYGRIAATNAISDVYAMLGRPLYAQNIVILPDTGVREGWGRMIIEGGAAAVRAAGIVITGGHSMQGPEPVYGLAVTGLVDAGNVGRKLGARPRDLLVLTKPLGTGILSTAVKAGDAAASALDPAIASMVRLNRGAAQILAEARCTAVTDVTGFGLLGHLSEMLAPDMGVEIAVSAVPLFTSVFDLARDGCLPGGARRNRAMVESALHLDTSVDPAWVDVLCDPQTSGGLLAAVGPNQLAGLHQAAKTAGEAVWVIGRWCEGPRRIRLTDDFR